MKRLSELGIVLPNVIKPIANYQNAVRYGNLLYMCMIYAFSLCLLDFIAGVVPINTDGSFMKGKDAQSLEKLFHQRFKEIDKLNKQNELTKKNLADLKKIQGMTLNKYGIVKYDAFDDVGGKMSFALAMLDKENTGFILNAIHSRDNCFLYLKEIVKGESYIMLSAEEIDALRQAITMNSIDLM